MFVEQAVTECDFTDKKYSGPVVGAGALSRGATGRWCVVMWAGPEYIADNRIKVLSVEEAERIIGEQHPTDRCDF